MRCVLALQLRMLALPHLLGMLFSCHALLAMPCLRCCSPATPRVLSRRHALIDVLEIRLCSVGGKHEHRKHVEAILRTSFCAMPAAEWKIVVHHTRSGQGNHAIKGKSGTKRTKVKQEIFVRALTRAAVSASTPGIVVGDLNLKIEQLREFLRGAVPHCQNIRFGGGQGRFKP